MNIPQDSIFYFAYGETKNSEMMAAITGNPTLLSYDAVLNGYGLYSQGLDSVPASIKDKVWEYWGDLTDSYRAPLIKPEGGSKVNGRVFILSPQEAELVQNYILLDPYWRSVTSLTLPHPFDEGGTITVFTNIIGNFRQGLERINRQTSDDFLNDKETSLRVAERRRYEFLEALKKPEGNHGRLESES